MEKKDYDSISPSAVSLIRLKALTNIPFAKETAAFLKKQSEELFPSHETMDKKMLFGMLFHFENRYYTIEKVLEKTGCSNMMELSSGYSFRGLAICREQPVHFIDTDLEAVIAVKKQIAATILPGIEKELRGKYELVALNALNESEFEATADRFPEGPVAIMNEGLLVYLEEPEKKKLCAIIHKILRQRGGYWITGDVYLKEGEQSVENKIGDKFSSFRKQHRIDENKFDSFESAEQFFNDCGFEIVYKEALALEKLSCLEMLPPDKKADMQQWKQIQSTRQTWSLKCKS